MNNVSPQGGGGSDEEDEEGEEEEDGSDEGGEDGIEEEDIEEPAENEPEHHDTLHGPPDEDAVPFTSARSHSPSQDSESSRSRSASPSSLPDRTAALSLSPSENAHSRTKYHDGGPDLKEKVHSEVSKRRVREVRKHHSKKGAQRVGRPKGSKAKQDARVKVDGGGFWD